MASSRELGDWLSNKAKTAATMRRKIISTTQRVSDYPMPGKMYFYFYDPKYKAVLPIYDRFPLVLPIEPYNDGFLGLNLHYLAIPARKELLNGLIKYRNNSFMDERTKIKVSYDLLKNTKYIGIASPAVKRYLFSHVESPFVEIVPSEWDKAINLPVAQFVKRK